MIEIKGYEGKYAITDDGKVWSFRSNRFLKDKNSNGYRRIGLCGTGFQVHRLVAQAYLEDWDENLMVDHIDRDKTNNKLSNLRMATRSLNGLNNNAKGIYFNKEKQRWKAQLQGRLLGYFDCPIEARDCYLTEKEKLFQGNK